MVGASAGSVPWATQVPLDVDGTVVNPGDLVFCDPVNGAVVIPRGMIAQVLEMMPRFIEADDRVKEAVAGGMSVHEAFHQHRGKI